jgi:WD40 repeat protein
MSPDSRYIISGSKDHTIRVWERSSGKTLSVLPAHTDQVQHITFCPDGQSVLSGSHDQTLRRWHLRDNGQLHAIPGLQGLDMTGAKLGEAETKWLKQSGAIGEPAQP